MRGERHDQRQMPGADLPQMQIDDAVVGIGLDPLADGIGGGRVGLHVEQDAAPIAAVKPAAHHRMTTAPTIPISGSSQASPSISPPSSATSASTDVSASVTTWT